jgi:hypothetical protein
MRQGGDTSIGAWRVMSGISLRRLAVSVDFTPMLTFVNVWRPSVGGQACHASLAPILVKSEAA